MREAGEELPFLLGDSLADALDSVYESAAPENVVELRR